MAFIGLKAMAQDESQVRIYSVDNSVKRQQQDTVSLRVDGSSAYYQKVVKLDSGVKVSNIYIRVLQFMAAKNFQQTYGYDQEGKLIFTTTQDLNINPVNITDENDMVEQYTAQFSITLDMKNGRYRYTIQNVVFFIPEGSGNRRLTLYDMYQKMMNKDSKRIARNAKSLITSYERYITTLTTELHQDIEHKSAIHNNMF
jgi:hypothetical protein